MSFEIKIINKHNNFEYFDLIIEKSKNLYINGFNEHYFNVVTFPSDYVICAFDINEKNKKLIGIASLIIDLTNKYSIKKCINFNSFTICQKYRKHGIGYMMIDYLKKYGKLLNIDAIVLSVEYTLNEPNNKLINYYKKNGFNIFVPESNFFIKPKYANPVNNYFYENKETCMKCAI